MKSTLALFLVIQSGMLMSQEACYKAVTKTPENVPQEFCLKSIALDVDSGIVRTEGSDANLPKVITNSSVIRNTEDTYKFESFKTIYDYEETVCGESIRAELVLKGESDLYGAVDAQMLNVKVNYETLHDSCHSHPVNETYEYKLVK